MRPNDTVGQPTTDGLRASAGEQVQSSEAEPPTSRIRVALLLDGLSQPAWTARAIADLAESPAVEIVLVVLNDAPAPERLRFQRLRSWVRNRSYLLYALYRRLDRWRFEEPNDPFAPVDVAPLLAGIPQHHVAPRMTKYCDYFEPHDIEAIGRYGIDVAARFGFRILKGDALNIARYGVWSYHHGDNLVNRGGPAGFWEVMEGTSVTGCVLQRLTEDLDDGHVLFRAFSSTNQFSVTKNLAGLYWTSAPILRNVIENLHRNGPEFVFSRTDVNPEWHGYSNRIYTSPKNGAMVRMFARVGWRYFAQKAHDLVAFEQWFVAYRVRKQGSTERFVPDTSFYRFKKLIPPPDRFWADPFAVQFDGRFFVFVEELLYQTDRGHISVFEITADGAAVGPVPALTRDYHLSYPFMFEWQGAMYMIPETHANGQIELFRATEFPHEWTFERVLMQNIRAVDVTLAEIDGRWWMFASLSPNHETPWDNLHIFFADSPLGPWTPHRQNPVKSDVRNARPAGRVFRSGGQYFRPAQNSAERYGHSIVINKIVTITEDEFVEIEISRINPHWTDRLLATHTINADSGLTVIDGLMSRRRSSR